MTAALEGVRVLSLVDGLGAYAARVLTGLGAEVTCVEPPAGSPERDRPSPYLVDEGGAHPSAAALYFIHYYAGARSVTLDGETPEGRPLLERLVLASDVVLDNGHLARLGFDLDDLATSAPGRAIVSVTPFGLDSPRAHWLGGDLVCQSMSGMLALFGYRGEQPARFGPEQASQMSGLAAAMGALIALFGARRGAGGAVVDVAAERVGALTTLQMANASMYHQFGFTRGRAPREEDGLPSGLYETADGYFALGAWRFPERMVALLEQVGEADGLRELMEERGAEFTVDPRANRLVRDFMARRTRAEVVALTQPAGVIGLPVHDVADVLSDPFLERRGFFVDVEGPGLPSPLRDVGVPVRMGGTPYRPGSRPPLLGEHTAETLGALGVGRAELTALANRGVV